MGQTEYEHFIIEGIGEGRGRVGEKAQKEKNRNDEP